MANVVDWKPDDHKFTPQCGTHEVYPIFPAQKDEHHHEAHP